MLKKGVIKRTQPVLGEFLNNLFLVVTKDVGYCPVINLKMLNQFFPFLHFKMEGLSQLKHLIQEGDWLRKLDMNDAYHWIKTRRSSKALVGGDSLRVHVPVLGTRPSTKMFTKLLKISLLRKINIRRIIYLDDILILS